MGTFRNPAFAEVLHPSKQCKELNNPSVVLAVEGEGLPRQCCVCEGLEGF